MSRFVNGMKRHTRVSIIKNVLWMIIALWIMIKIITVYTPEGNHLRVFFREGSVVIGDVWIGSLAVACIVCFIVFAIDLVRDIKQYYLLSKKSS